MQDLTLINADDELALHTPDARMRRDPMDEMSSGASTLPRAKSTSARQSKAAQHASPTRHQQQLHVEKHGVVHKCMNTHKLCLQLADWPRAWRRRLPLFNFRAGLGLLRPSGVMWFKALQGGKKGWGKKGGWGRQCKEDRARVKTCDPSGRGGLEGGLFVSRCTAGWLTVWVQAVSWIQRDTETMKSRGRVVHFNMYNAFFFFFFCSFTHDF